jgi:hypothetical protein
LFVMRKGFFKRILDILNRVLIREQQLVEEVKDSLKRLAHYGELHV